MRSLGSRSNDLLGGKKQLWSLKPCQFHVVNERKCTRDLTCVLQGPSVYSRENDSDVHSLSRRGDQLHQRVQQCCKKWSKSVIDPTIKPLAQHDIEKFSVKLRFGNIETLRLPLRATLGEPIGQWVAKPGQLHQIRLPRATGCHRFHNFRSVTASLNHVFHRIGR